MSHSGGDRGRDTAHTEVRPMEQIAVQALLDRYVNDPAFRLELRTGLDGVVRMSGVEIAADQLAALGTIDWALTDDELRARVDTVE